MSTTFVYNFLSEIIDETHLTRLNLNVFLCGDLNAPFNDHFLNTLCNDHNLYNSVTKPTRKMALLDVIIISESLKEIL